MLRDCREKNFIDPKTGKEIPCGFRTMEEYEEWINASIKSAKRWHVVDVIINTFIALFYIASALFIIGGIGYFIYILCVTTYWGFTKDSKWLGMIMGVIACVIIYGIPMRAFLKDQKRDEKKRKEELKEWRKEMAKQYGDYWLK